MPFVVPRREITAAELHRDPELLTHKKSTSPHENEFSYRVGAVLMEGAAFAVSPNVDYVYQPPLGDDRPVFSRSNLCFGQDDYLQWPQPYIPRHAHLAAILRKPERNSDPKAILWWTPDDYDPGLVSTPSNSNIAFLEPSRLGQLQNCVAEVRRGVSEYTAKHPVPNESNNTELAQFLLNLVNNFDTRLTSLPMTHFELRRCIAGLQRFVLELEALLRWANQLSLRIHGHHDPAKEVDSSRMGAFTNSPGVVSDLVKAGLPVWFLQEVRMLNNIRIDAACVAIQPEGVILMEKSRRINFPTIFTGRADDPLRVQNIHAASRIVLTQATIDVFAWYPSPSVLAPSRSRDGGSSAIGLIRTHAGVQVNRHSYHNTTVGESQRKNISSNLIVTPPTDPCLPGIHSAWLKALGTINGAQVPGSLPTDRGHGFPDPSLFYDKVNKTIRKDYVYRYLQLCPALLYRLTPSAPATMSSPYPARVWRRILGISIPDIEKAKSAAARNTKAAQVNLEAVNAMEGWISTFGEKVSLSVFLERACPPWRGVEIPSAVDLPDDIARQVVWQVHELNFRLELLGLDRRLFHRKDDSPEYETEAQRHEALLDCLVPLPFARALLIVENAQAQEGLAAPDIRRRLPQLIHLHTLMSKWTTPASPHGTVTSSSADAVLADFEVAVLTSYVLDFFNIFGRSPTVPRYL